MDVWNDVPKVSVVMCVYNVSMYLGAAIDSVIGQSFSDWEMVIVDDCSTDGSDAILRKYAGRDGRIRIIWNDKNLGFVRSLNRAIESARSDIICRMDPDDISLPDRIHWQFEFLRNNPGIDLVSGWLCEISETGVLLGVPPFNVQLTDPVLLRYHLLQTNQLVHPATMFRKALFTAVGGYRREFPVAEDYDLWLRMTEKGRGVCLRKVALYYRRSPSSVTLRKPALSTVYSELARECCRIRQLDGNDSEYLKSFASNPPSESNATQHLSGGSLIGIATTLAVFGLPQEAKIYARSGLLRRTELNVFLIVKGILVLSGLFQPLWRLKSRTADVLQRRTPNEETKCG